MFNYSRNINSFSSENYINKAYKGVGTYSDFPNQA